jgi:hypothetical protein
MWQLRQLISMHLYESHSPEGGTDGIDASEGINVCLPVIWLPDKEHQKWVKGARKLC